MSCICIAQAHAFQCCCTLDMSWTCRAEVYDTWFLLTLVVACIMKLGFCCGKIALPGGYCADSKVSIQQAIVDEVN